ncbi:unnamed protein product [Mytilus edulis]|uniref:Uncharacterized protein n=1 Tax=Mytilus edulis TaxID=6550 RepID=A0A8S3SUK9_MYTED|nr:unnamed protein product [Mytilus edulis]
MFNSYKTVNGTEDKNYSLTDFRRVFSSYDYPLCLYEDVLHKGISECHQKLDKLGEDKNWDELVSLVNTGNVDYTGLPIKDDSNSLPSLYTPLHHAAAGNAPKYVFEDLLKKGATKCFKTTNGETAYDLAVKNSLGEDILKLLELPENVKNKSESIAIMEKSLHAVILERVEKLIQEHGVQLPQLAFLYEKGPFHYSVPMMYGGFNTLEDSCYCLHSLKDMVRSTTLCHRLLNWVSKSCCCRRLCSRKDREASSSKEPAVTGEIDDLPVFSSYDYPTNVYEDVFHIGFAECHQKLDKLGEDKNWDELVSLVNTGNVDFSRLPIKDDSNSLPSLSFEKGGATKCFKTTNGETAYDLAVKNSLEDEILKLLELQENVKNKSESIAIMEKSLHAVILERVETLIQEHGVQLPQLAFLYEKGPFHYSVPMMYGGFNVKKYNDGIKVHSFCRVWGGSEQDHIIERNGKTTLKATGYDCAY